MSDSVTPYVSQEPRQKIPLLPEFVRQLPRIRFTRPNPRWQLISETELTDYLSQHNVDQKVIDELTDDIKDIDYEVMRLFRERDYEASEQQNRYRTYQLSYMLLATVATFLGSLQAVLFANDPGYVPILALLQTVIAGLTTFLSFISTRESPLPRWMEARRRAEFLRREYFRYLLDLPPYDTFDQTDLGRANRKMKLGTRAADVNAGTYPVEPDGSENNDTQ
jgi:Protein of unknown function (DUF4231)